MQIAILGTRGIPGNYGGFETFAEELSARLVERGHRVTVYCRTGNSPGRPVEYRGVHAVRPIGPGNEARAGRDQRKGMHPLGQHERGLQADQAAQRPTQP